MRQFFLIILFLSSISTCLLLPAMTSKIEACKSADSEEYLVELELYGDSLADIERFDEARDVRKQCVELTAQIFGKSGKEYARSLYDYSLVAYLSNHYEEARKSAIEAARLGEELLNSSANDYKKNKLEIAKIYSTYDCYADAARIGHELLAEFPDLNASNMRDISSYLKKNDEFIEAEKVLDLTLQRLDPNNEKERIPYYIGICDKSNFLSEMGRYMEAIELLEEELSNVTSNERVYKLLLTNLSGLFQQIGNLRRGAQITREIWNLENGGIQTMPDAVRREIECEESGVRYLPTQEDYMFLLQMDEEMLRELESLGMQDTQDYAEILKTEASTYMLSGSPDKGLPLIDRALDIILRIKGDNSSDYSDFLETKAMLLYSQENYKESFPLFERVVEIRNNLYGSTHQEYIFTLQYLALNASKLGDKRVDDLTKEAADGMNKSIRNAFVSLSPTERNMFWDTKSKWFTISLPSITYKNPQANLESTLYDGVLLSKGVLLNTELEQTALLKSIGSEEIDNKYYTLHSLRKKLSESKSLTIEERDSIERRAIIIERELTAKSKEFGDYTKAMSYTWKDVQTSLGAEDLAIEFVEIPIGEKVIMGALLLKKNYESPRLFEIIDMSSPWASLKEELKGVKRIFFSPAGQLYSLPIEYIPLISESTGKPIAIYRLSSTRMLMPASSSPGNSGSLLYGDINYNLGIAEVKADMKVKADSNERYRGNESPLLFDDERGFLQGYSNLPETGREVEEIGKVLGEAQIGNIVLKTGNEATEADFKRNAPDGYRIIHLATHGYYLAPNQNDSQEKNSIDAESDALNRCGLVMAGANSALRNKARVINENIDDGTLTGQEIGLLDLRSVDLVSLSACETGLGDLTYDGVMGLQRGFKKAGAKTLLMSLWKVSDKSASIFMSEFYGAIGKGKSKVEALVSAREALSIYMDEDGNTPFNSPKYLDAFILLDAI